MRAPGLMSTGAPAFGLRPWAHLLRSRGTMARPASPRRLIDSPALRIGQRFAAASKGSGRKTKFHQPDPLWFFRHSVTLLTASAGCPQSEQRSCLHVAARTERAVLIASKRSSIPASAFLRTLDMPRLYSGEIMITPSLASIVERRVRTDSGACSASSSSL